MACEDIPKWYLRHRIPVINLASSTWQEVCAETLTPGTAPSVCLQRLAGRDLIRPLRRGLYLVLDPAREAPLVAVADAAFVNIAHYITTDAAFAVHGLLDQPLPRSQSSPPRKDCRRLKSDDPFFVR